MFYQSTISSTIILATTLIADLLVRLCMSSEGSSLAIMLLIFQISDECLLTESGEKCQLHHTTTKCKKKECKDSHIEDFEDHVLNV